MIKLFLKLRIGEKIGLGFGLVGLLFLLVIWQYHATLKQSLQDYRHLQEVSQVKKDRIRAIETHLLQARQSEQAFRLTRDSRHAAAVAQHVESAFQQSEQIAQLDAKSVTLADEFKVYLRNYLKHFQAVEAAWVSKGLHEDSGLQGSFRQAVHDLENAAARLNTDQLYLTLLQVRRGEKDLGLRRDPQYRDRVFALLGELGSGILASGLDPLVKQAMREELDVYQREFAVYADRVLAGEDLLGGKGPFRDSAHRLEDQIRQHYVPDLERDILQLRRREKDYLLRGDRLYVDMTLGQVALIEERIRNSSLNGQDREPLLSLLNQYRADFMALVEQNGQLSELTEKMEQVATSVVELVNNNVQASNLAMAEITREIHAISEQRINWMLWVVAIAIGLGVTFAVKITYHIVRPVRRIAATLEKMTYTELVEPMRYTTGGRDEINAMSGSLNTLAEHRNRFINWWQSSMNEIEVCRQLQSIIDNDDLSATEAAGEVSKIRSDLVETLQVKKILMSEEFMAIREQNEKILRGAAVLQHASVSREEVDEQGKVINYAGQMIRKSLDMLSAKTV